MEYCLINLEYQNLDVLFIQPRRQELFKSHFGGNICGSFFTGCEKSEWIGYVFF